MEGMMKNSNLMVTAWDDEKMVGIARSMTDFHYACSCRILPFTGTIRKKASARGSLILTQRELGPKCKLILGAAPSANSYYEHVGFKNNPRCWVLDREQNVGSLQAASAERKGIASTMTGPGPKVPD